MRYLVAFAFLLLFLLLTFVVVEIVGVPILADPTPWMKQDGILPAAVGVGLLLADVILPVPSSLVMVAHGALFGVFLGALLSLIGGVGGACVGFALGRQGEPLLTRFVSPRERERASELLSRWGGVAIVVSRPIPLLAEAVVIVAGMSSMKWSTLILAGTVGLLPSALMYSIAGAVAASFENAALVFGLAILLGGVFWLINLLFEKKRGVGP